MKVGLIGSGGRENAICHKVVGEGKHDELLTSSEVYKNFYEKQVRK